MSHTYLFLIPRHIFTHARKSQPISDEVLERSPLPQPLTLPFEKEPYAHSRSSVEMRAPQNPETPDIPMPSLLHGTFSKMGVRGETPGCVRLAGRPYCLHEASTTEAFSHVREKLIRTMNAKPQTRTPQKPKPNP